MRKVHLIRHGTTEASRRRLYYGRTDLPLSPDAEKELLELKKRGIYPSADGCRVFTTGMLRTEQTLEILYPGAEAEQAPGLREMDFGDFELRGYEELKNDPAYQRWLTGDYLANVCPGGESAVQHGDRCLKALTELMEQEPGDILIICHGGSITALMERLFPDEGENRWYWERPVGRGYTVLFEGKVPKGHTEI